MHYWLLKSEPTSFSIDDLAKRPHQTTHWDGVRNYQARNFLRDQMQSGHLAFFYHSNATPPGIVGIVEVIKSGYPDFTAWEPGSEHPDPASTKENPRWYMVDVKLKQKFQHIISLERLKTHPALTTLLVTRPGNRLSITPVTEKEWKIIVTLGSK